MKNFNVTNMVLLLAGALFIMGAYYDKQVVEIIKAVLAGDMSIFSGVPTGQEATDGSSGKSGFDGGGGFGGGTPIGGSW